jgi:8-oxo-dGTP pyrophosphatase MutT (NUDIX family)
MMTTHSAGIVIIRYEEDKPLILLMRSYQYWDFPKGGVEENENKLNAAMREVKEESGIDNLVFKWGKSFHQTEPYGKNNKVVSYFIAETDEKKVVMGVNEELGRPEHDEYRWVTFNEARELAGNRIKRVLRWAEERMNYEVAQI